MKAYYLNSLDSNRLSIIFLAGSTQKTYGKNHKLVKFFSKYNVNLVTLVLPGHEHMLPIPKDGDEYLNVFYDDVQELLSKLGDVIFVGFSIGGISILKLAELNLPQILYSICIGSSLFVEPEEAMLIQSYFTMKTFEERDYSWAMHKMHGENWVELVESLAKILCIDSTLWPQADKIDPRKVLLILGDADHPFPLDKHKSKLKDFGVSVKVVENTGHFDYFTTSWVELKVILEKITQENPLGPLLQLLPSQ
ncbi:MAG: alpha/beta hydrolase [Candidatus Heimdallarchaeota archaeon]|nr:alpha/beta hydrolase [Candidatus Heimdallarchaeota archaeon]